jgi:DNA-binding transcriptional ArsR family regulator
LVNRIVPADRLSATFAALADPTRRAILARLAAGETTVTELAQPFAMSLPAVTKHLKVLENAGLITRGREAQYRPCRLAPEPLKAATDWLEAYRQHWEERLDGLERYLRELQAEGKEKRRGRKSRK